MSGAGGLPETALELQTDFERRITEQERRPNYGGRIAELQQEIIEALGLGRRNLIRNARFRINQRGVASGASLASGAYFLDGWKSGTSTNAVTWTGSDALGRTVTVPASETIQQDIEQADVLPDDYLLVNYGTAEACVYNVGGSVPAKAAASEASPLVVALDGTAAARVEFGPGTVINPALVRADSWGGFFPDISLAADLAWCRRYFRAFAAGVVSILNPYFSVGLSGGAQYPIVPDQSPMRIAPTIRRSDGTTGVHSFDYLSTSAGSPINRNVQLTGATVDWVSGNYASADNGGSTLSSGYANGANKNPIWLDAEL